MLCKAKIYVGPTFCHLHLKRVRSYWISPASPDFLEKGRSVLGSQLILAQKETSVAAALGGAGFPWELGGPEEQGDGREVATGSTVGKVTHSVRTNFGYKKAACMGSSEAGIDPGALGHQELIKSH